MAAGPVTSWQIDGGKVQTVTDFIFFSSQISANSDRQFSWVAQSCLTLCDPMDCSTPGFPVHHQLPKLAQTHVHRVGDAIQPSHPLWFPSPAFNLSLNQGLFQWVSSSHQVAKVLEFQLKHQSFQWIFRTDFTSLQSQGLSRVFSNTTVQKHQFFGYQVYSQQSCASVDTWPSD